MINNLLQGWTEVATNTYFQLLAGGPGYVDTDISSIIPGNARLALFSVVAAGGTTAGVRAPGSTVERAVTVVSGHGIFAGACRVIAGHVEFYQSNTQNLTYFCFGYLE
jgi:hypothetical protein